MPRTNYYCLAFELVLYLPNLYFKYIKYLMKKTVLMNQPISSSVV